MHLFLNSFIYTLYNLLTGMGLSRKIFANSWPPVYIYVSDVFTHETSEHP